MLSGCGRCLPHHLDHHCFLTSCRVLLFLFAAASLVAGLKGVYVHFTTTTHSSLSIEVDEGHSVFRLYNVRDYWDL